MVISIQYIDTCGNRYTIGGNRYLNLTFLLPAIKSRNSLLKIMKLKAEDDTTLDKAVANHIYKDIKPPITIKKILVKLAKLDKKVRYLEETIVLDLPCELP